MSQAYFFLPYYAGPYTEEFVVPAGGALAKPLPPEKPHLRPRSWGNSCKQNKQGLLRLHGHFSPQGKRQIIPS